VAAFAVVDCFRRRPDAFFAADRRTKQFWLAVTAAAFVASLFSTPLSLLGLPSIVASLLYVLDVRPRLAEVTRGGW
jgi:hypothetical protein